MYEHLFHFFGLRENPFHVSPDPRFYFPTRAHDAALAELVIGVDTRQGFIVLTGEAGTGKTTVLHHFLNWLQERQQSSSYIFHSLLKPVELFEFILRDFGVPYQTQKKSELLARLHQWLIQRHALGDSPVLILDEAQAISSRTLDQLRLLLNLETPGSKLLQIVLAGQPELEEKLRRPRLRQLRQRVMFRCTLQPLSAEESARYVKSRLANAGAGNVDLFTPESLEFVQMYARGIPRTVNLLCEHALIAAYAQHVKVVSPDMIRRVAADFDLTSQPAAYAEREASTNFGRLLPFRPEERPMRKAAEVMATEAIVQEPVPQKAVELVPAQAEQSEPVFILEETLSLASEQVQEPFAETQLSPISPVVTQHEVLTLIAKPAEDPGHALPKELPVGWQGLSLSERFLSYWKDVKDSFARDWRHFLGAHGSAKAAATHSGVERLKRDVIVPITKWLQEPGTIAAARGRNRSSRERTRKRR